jgi:uncharacterized protein YjbI with pentapeptide repeats
MPRKSIALIVTIAILAVLLAADVFLRGVPGGATMNPGIVGAIVGATVSFVGVLIGQYLTGRTQRELEAQRAYEDALRKYLELVGKLLVEHELHTPDAAPKLGIVARAQTLVALEGMDPRRKRILLQFLHEADLIIGGDRQIVSLAGAPLREANLNGVYLRGADLSGVDLSRADLCGADLNGTYLSGACLDRADLSGADLCGAYLNNTDLSGADLSGADLNGADLGEARLRGADLSGADLSGADLSRAELSGVDFSGANLSRAELLAVRGISKVKLEQQAKSLTNATMPDGSRHH